MSYKILHLPTATYMYYSLMTDGKTNTKNFYTHYEIEHRFYTYIDSPVLQIFNTKSMATRFLDRWEQLATEENNGDVDALVFESDKDYVFKRCHFSITKVNDV